MSVAVELKNVSFTYKSRTVPNLSNVNLSINSGDFVLVTGPTGCGKSTLLKTLNGLIPHESGGRLTGDVVVEGYNTGSFSIAELSRHVGMMFQCPDDQIFSTTVADEVGFVLENMGKNPCDVLERVREALEMVGLEDKEQDSVHALSGGQKQRLALAAVLAAHPRILALDEPISQLDPKGAAELLQVLKRLNKLLGMTIIIVEHRLHEVMPLCNRVVVMDAGKIIWQGTRTEAFQNPDIFSCHGLRLPQTVDICRQLAVEITTAGVIETVTAIKNKYNNLAAYNSCAHHLYRHTANSIEPVIEIEDLTYAYSKKGPRVLNNINLSIYKGQFVALMGNNGAGKSTLLQHIGGLIKPVKGKVNVLWQRADKADRQVGFVMQNPDFMLFNSTVADEVYFALRQYGQYETKQEYCQMLMTRLGLNNMETDFPLSLSRGQRLRVAIAAVLSYQPAILLLDEPTTGQDIGHIEDIVLLLQEYTKQGGTVIFCTHDAEVAAKYAQRVIVMSNGRIIADASPTEVFTDTGVLVTAGLKPPAALEVSKQLYKGEALTVEEVVKYVRQASLGSDTEKYAYSQA